MSFIAEVPLRGVQVTVDGFVQGGQVTVMGVVDSVMFPGTQSFQRFEYPSTLPESVSARMADITRRFVQGSGLDHSCFNVEMFYEAETDHISIIELNPRMSYQFSDLYARVDGLSLIDVQLALATGRSVPWVPGSGPDRAAASFVGRQFVDGRVSRVPSDGEIHAAYEAFPSAHIEVLCKVGERLSELPQDMGSFRYSITNLAARDREALFSDHARLEKMLAFEFD